MELFCKILLITAISLALFGETFSKIPNYIKVCRASDPRVTQCIATSIKDLLPKLKNGIRELDLPPIEPLHLHNIKLSTGKHSNISNLYVYGITTFKLTDLKTDVVHNRFMFKSVAPTLHFNGNYDLDMKLVFIPIKGQGKISGVLNNFHADGMMHGKKIWRNGKQYLHFEIPVKMHSADAKLQLDNLFGGDPFLGQVTNSVINSNINVIMDDIMPALENSLSQDLTSIANKIMDRFTYDELFPQ
ncbi:LOW QUALITY PROTEIN: protein takeout-like [Atheta coriaria]|uniref:LOW QUALITY PROTEIN: protein takeout-like n=1 Tax=Dalotia coriaria TaxID=877792 RepID=UPI0031F3D805